MNNVQKGLVFAVLLTVGVFRATADDRGALLEKAEEWERAGFNREMAAANQQSEGDLLLSQAVEILRSEGDQAQETLGRRLVNCGNLRRRAGDLYGAAVGNLERAAENWGRAAAGFHDLELGEREREAEARKDHAQLNATTACENAARAYEQAAASYQNDAAGESGLAAAANEKAAQWREKLATRR